MTTPYPRIGFGTADLPGDVTEIVKTAIRAGYRLIDTAQAYGTEETVGAAVCELVAGGEVKRDELLIQSKISSVLGYQETFDVVEKALKLMNIDYFDNFFIHWPILRYHEHNWREEITATWSAMEGLHYAGKIRYLSVSNFLERHLLHLLNCCRIKPLFNQLEIHPDFQQKGLVESCRSWGICTQAWQPLGHELVESPEIAAIAVKYQASPAQLLLSWSIQQGHIPLVRSSNKERIKANLHVFTIGIDDLAILNAMNTATNHCDIWSYKRREMY